MPKERKTRSQKKYYYSFGRRKGSIASVRIYEGKGDSTINSVDIKEAQKTDRNIIKIFEPFKVTDTDGKFYFTIKVKGGGKSSQIDAIKLAISRALLRYDSSFRKELKNRKLLRVDGRVKERKKPGLKKARKQESRKVLQSDLRHIRSLS